MSPDPVEVHRRTTAGRLGPGPHRQVGTTRGAVERAGRDLDSARSGLGASWAGGTAEAARRALDRRSATLLAADAELSVARDLLADLATTQREVRASADALLLAWLAAVLARGPADPGSGAAVTASVVRELHTLQAHLRAEVVRTAAAFDALAHGAEGAVPLDPGAGEDPPATVGAAAVVPAGADPTEAARWWAGLEPGRRAALVLSRPDELAALRGLPPTVLDQVNRARVHRDLERSRAADAEATTRLGRPGDNPLVRTELLVERSAARNLATMAAAADDAVRTAESTGPGPVLLLWYTPHTERGVAVGFGDPSTATDVAVTVPGTGSRLTDPQLHQAAALRAQMDADDPGGSHAVVQWVDYTAPLDLLDADVTRTGIAAAAADELAADVDGWRAAHDVAGGDRQHVTVVGHSYGGAVVGLAAAAGMAADDVVLLGSPGVGVGSAAELGVDPGHVWAAAAEHDPVVQATAGSWFSPDGVTGPYDADFGARVFDAPDPATQLGAHSTYYDPGSEALRNLAAVATGDPDEVTPATPEPGLAEAVGDVVGHARATVAAGDLAGAWDVAADGLGELAADVADAVLGGLGTATSEVRGFGLDLLGGAG